MQEQIEQLSSNSNDIDYEYDDQPIFQFVQNEQGQLNKYDVVDILEVKNKIEKQILQVQEKTWLSKDNSIELLQHCNWKILDVEQQYFKDDNPILIELQGVCYNHSNVTYPLDNDVPIPCSKCLNQSPPIQLGCLHKFCANCIQLEIQHNLEKNSIKIKCLIDECVYQLPFSMVYQLGQPIQAQQLLVKQFIDNSQDFILCPNNQCQNILKQPKFSKVQCSCGTSWCFKCKKPDHSPVTCQMCDNWNLFIDGVQVEEAMLEQFQQQNQNKQFQMANIDYFEFFEYQESCKYSLQKSQQYIQFQKPIISNLWTDLELKFIEDAYDEIYNQKNFIQWTHCLSYIYQDHIIKSYKIIKELSQLKNQENKLQSLMKSLFTKIDSMYFNEMDLNDFLIIKREIKLQIRESYSLREYLQQRFLEIQLIDA